MDSEFPVQPLEVGSDGVDRQPQFFRRQIRTLPIEQDFNQPELSDGELEALLQLGSTLFARIARALQKESHVSNSWPAIGEVGPADTNLVSPFAGLELDNAFISRNEPSPLPIRGPQAWITCAQFLSDDVRKYNLVLMVKYDNGDTPQIHESITTLCSSARICKLDTGMRYDAKKRETRSTASLSFSGEFA
jgi:hypothetical protein